MDWLDRLPFRLGTTSYILPDEILPNARYLAGKVKDLELVLFEVEEGQDNLPSAEVVQSLLGLASDHDLSYTVHLPLDLKLGTKGNLQRLSMHKANCAIEATSRLEPWAYVVHLDASEVREGASEQSLAHWKENASQALHALGKAAGSVSRMAVENLENYPESFWEVALQDLPASRCLDVGHLWLEGADPLPHLERSWSQMRVIHLHGINERDHASLEHVPEERLDSVIKLLCSGGFSGVVTLEVFGQADFEGSLEAVKNSCRRVGAG